MIIQHENIVTRVVADEDLRKIAISSNRYWDGEQGVNVGRVLALHHGNLDARVVFVRTDGWSVCCSLENQHSCFELWKDQWKEIYYPASLYEEG